MQPIFLLADSSLLFSNAAHGGALRDRIRSAVGDDDPSAAFLGEPEAVELFDAAMDALGIAKRRAIGARYSAMDDMCLRAADLIVLGGGDLARGWERVGAGDVKDAITRRYLEGAVLVGVSAGAILLGVGSEALRMVPFAIEAHAEEDDWRHLRTLVTESTIGIGIPFGAAAVYADGTLEPIGKPLVELRLKGSSVVESLLLPAL
ncbi:MAG TPA: Type 1 glutamine amidotransferase-like domain-containing protein [Polyangiaceae bacterium]|jgi:cyanophycinase|nr:Type 1 glutamine amidotransferase-like domain-containing protein [Polyangiaceae bacterium]